MNDMANIIQAYQLGDIFLKPCMRQAYQINKNFKKLKKLPKEDRNYDTNLNMVLVIESTVKL